MNHDIKALAAANFIKEHCSKMEAEGCIKCCFSVPEWGCVLNDPCAIPEDWELPVPHRWTKGDIMLAKALQEFGVSKIRRSKTGGTYWVSGTGRSSMLPVHAFAELHAGETVSIDEILEESGDV